ncbi:exodeoxyribonuclease VII large subunit [Thiospirochaeta perfilievii]|uniref:Exodeoxyribonuclease 7 large subunit n=1 Tax=Thiospirochaeta perfilievii TaxID=252967 RepID=A0A5C1QAQ9_9SPIO|nr:exodeoxyribonuclease VII large subunit [Thiospirochaeta perfilievii]QEN03242.1 exodeoxyribonuclease VII large subunit [Thiospirochaeta perfilievii]
MELENHLFTVSELNQIIKDVLESSFYSIQLEGEISNFRPASSGHWYFSLKDSSSNISVVMFKNSSYAVDFTPKDGMKVKVTGKLSLYSQRGTYQIICSKMTQFGEGQLLLMLEERKRKLASLGLFDPSIKKPLPRYPNRIGIITSHTGAALQDILRVLHRRHCLSNILVLPTSVQGVGAEKTIVKQLKKANKDRLCDLIILSRGGGSVEDLLPFSEESVVKEIYRSNIPIITGIGHEIDTTLSDYAADVRASTPSAAGEIATEGAEQLYNSVFNLKISLHQSIKVKISNIRSKIQIFDRDSVKRVLNSKIESSIISIDYLKKDMLNGITTNISRGKNSITQYINTIEALSPFKLFEKGYSWVTKDNRSILNQKINPGDTLEVKYKLGTIKTTVKENR